MRWTSNGERDGSFQPWLKLRLLDMILDEQWEGRGSCYFMQGGLVLGGTVQLDRVPVISLGLFLLDLCHDWLQVTNVLVVFHQREKGEGIKRRT